MKNQIKKIGLVTWYNSLNYGTSLQAFALYKYLSIKGFDVFLYDFDNLRSIYRFKNKISYFKYYFLYVCYLFGLKVDDKNIKIYKLYKYKQQFRFKRLGKKKDFCDIYIAGSDQIWNPDFLDTKYMLDFVPDSIKKISFATSIGVNKIPDDKVEIYKRNLNRFYSIALREITAVELISNFVQNEIKLVIDPTLLFSEKYWNLYLKNIDNKYCKYANEKYLLCYFVGSNIEYWEEVLRFSKLNGNLKIIQITSLESGVLSENGIVLNNVGTFDFVWLIKYASLICTDSFHATAFSINYKKEFIVFERHNKDSVNSQNSRIYDLLNTFHLERRLFNPKIQNYTQIDYSVVENILIKKREESSNYLLEILK